MEYKISKLPPPIYEEAVKAFGLRPGMDFYSGVVFTYGDTIHTNNGHLDPDLLVHELVHVKQHSEFTGGAAAWWKRYMKDKDFCLEQELEAYHAQYLYICRKFPNNKAQRNVYLQFYAKCLCMLYGQKLALIPAMKMIRGDL